MSSPLQFGLWDVEGLGLVVAYRGTASLNDVFVDTNIQPIAVEGASPSTGWGPCSPRGALTHVR